MPKPAVVMSDETHVLRLIAALYGAAPPESRLSTILRRNPRLDTLDWSLLVLSIEIELRVSMTPRLLDAGRWTLGSFARAVASLPKQDSVTHTLDRLTLLVDELLAAPPKAEPPSPRATRKAQGNGAQASTKARSSKSHQSGSHAPRRPTR